MSGPVLHLAPKWSETIMVDPREEHLCCVRPDLTGGLSMTLRVQTGYGPVPLGIACRVGDPDADFSPRGECLAIRRWGLRRLGPTVWQLVPSVVQGSLHAYVVLCDVPEPAPFLPAVPGGER